MIGHADEIEPFLDVDAQRAHAIDGHAAGDRTIVADRAAHEVERLEPEARAIGERAAVLVPPPVVVRREELPGQVRVRAVDVDDVEARAARLTSRAHPVVLNPADVALRHRPGHEPGSEVARDLRGRRRGQP